ncbi:MAG: hypothetical protein AAF765_16560, partial [Bacteroidota bacterium]
PLPGSWERIAEQLSTEVSPKPRKRFGYAVAASFIGILLISGFLLIWFHQKDTPMEIEVVGEDGSKKSLNVVDKVLGDEKRALHDGQQRQSIIVDSEEHFVEDSFSKVAEAEKSEQFDIPSENSELEDSVHLIALKANEVLEQVTFLEQKNEIEITDAEVDSLLRKAQEEILNEKRFTLDGKVDAMALLTEVEDELDASFRGQIFEALKGSYLKLRTAVADRNN